MLPNPMLGTAKEQAQIHEPTVSRDDGKTKPEAESTEPLFPNPKKKEEKEKLTEHLNRKLCLLRK